MNTLKIVSDLKTFSTKIYIHFQPNLSTLDLLFRDSFGTRGMRLVRKMCHPREEGEGSELGGTSGSH